MVVGHGDDVESPMASGEIIVEGEGELAGGSGFGSMFDRDTSTVADHLVILDSKKKTQHIWKVVEATCPCVEMAGCQG